MNNFFKKYRRGLVLGFILGLVISLVAMLGLGSRFFEILRPLAAPGRYASQLFLKPTLGVDSIAYPIEEPIPTEEPTSDDLIDLTPQEKRGIKQPQTSYQPQVSYQSTPLTWVVYFLVNGIFYALVGFIVQILFSKRNQN